VGEKKLSRTHIDHNQSSQKMDGGNPRCPLSHPTNPHTLSKSGQITKFGCFTCGKKAPLSKRDRRFSYYCITCDVSFHKGCHIFPRKLTHPYHLQHPLTFTFPDYESGITSDSFDYETYRTAVKCHSQFIITYSLKKPGSIECSWCGKNIEDDCFYRCSICNFYLDLSCSQSIPLLLVANPKSHQHPLVFYRRPLLTPCDACGLVNVLDPSYACFQCNYMVHQSCIDLPRVIKITRHRHRLSHIPCVQSPVSPCGVCYQKVENKYGLYSCNRYEDHSYVVHSKCATHENIWDGKELEWEPEEPENIEDILPFKKVGTDMIKYFSHEHNLKLEKYDAVRDAEKLCQACVCPINSRDFYNCIHCDFFLHEVCAGLLRKLDHALHKHTLILDPYPRDSYYLLDCPICSRGSTGFRYICSISNCNSHRIGIDIRCILVPDHFTHESHEHPLFISTSFKAEIRCQGCQKECMQSYLQCTICIFIMCYKCATIPTEVSYKHDKHPLSLCYGEKADDTYWCELCEKEVNPRNWFYTCNICCITIHLHCIFGSSSYMKPGSIFDYNYSKLEVLRNSNSTRPQCTRCGDRCPGYIYFKRKRDKHPVTFSCSVQCLEGG